MSDISERIDEVIASHLKAHMKAAGYRKSGRTFARSTPDGWSVLNIQASQWNQSDSGSFTVNLGSYYFALAEFDITPLAPGKPPAEYACHLRQRIGMLMPGQTDHWWDVTSTTNADALGSELATQCVAYALPFLTDSATNDGGLNALKSDKQYFHAAAMAHALGRPWEASACLKLALKQQPLAAARIRAWAERHSIRSAPD